MVAVVVVAGVVDVVATGFLTIGALLILLAGVGVVRFPDVTSRQHAAAKAPVLGILFAGIGTALAVRTAEAAIVAGLVILLQLIAAPVGSHMLGHSVYHRLSPQIDGVDELAEADVDSEWQRSGGNIGSQAAPADGGALDPSSSSSDDDSLDATNGSGGPDAGGDGASPGSATIDVDTNDDAGEGDSSDGADPSNDQPNPKPDQQGASGKGTARLDE